MRAASTDLAFIRALLNRELGDPLYPEAALERDLDDPEVAIFVEPEAGSALARVLVPDDLGYYLPFGELAQRAFAAGPVGSLEALAVAPGARRRGVGTRLVEAAEAWFRDVGVRAIAVVGWDSGRPDTSLSLLRRLGYLESPPVAEFYARESEHDGWSCPVDGRPCRCTAVLFVRFV